MNSVKQRVGLVKNVFQITNKYQRELAPKASGI